MHAKEDLLRVADIPANNIMGFAGGRIKVVTVWGELELERVEEGMPERITSIK